MNWTAPLLVLLAVWLIVQTLGGDLPGRLLSYGRPRS